MHVRAVACARAASPGYFEDLNAQVEDSNVHDSTHRGCEHPVTHGLQLQGCVATQAAAAQEWLLQEARRCVVLAAQSSSA